ncbi:MAG TPA: hypothetical protein VF070_43250 [Streptosporangiaceae bacterium]
MAGQKGEQRMPHEGKSKEQAGRYPAPGGGPAAEERGRVVAGAWVPDAFAARVRAPVR